MKILEQLRFPSSQRDTDVVKHLSRRCHLLIITDSDSGTEEQFTFHNVYSTQITYHTACTLEMIEAYGKLVEIEASEWLNIIRHTVNTNERNAIKLKHFRIYLDDGPCYEFICDKYEHTIKRG